MSVGALYSIPSGSAADTSTAAGYVYGTGPIAVLTKDPDLEFGASAVPEVFASTLNARIFDRYDPNKYFFWSPNSEATVDVYYTASTYAVMDSLIPQDTFTMPKEDEVSWSAGQLRAGGAPSNVSGANQANPAQITASSHGFVDGEGFTFSGFNGGGNGFSQLNGNRYFADRINENVFNLYSDSSLTTTVSTASFSAYVGGGVATGDANDSQATSGMHIFVSDAKILGWAYGQGSGGGDKTALHPLTNTSLVHSIRTDKVRGIQLNSTSSTFTTYTNGSGQVTVSEDPNLYLTSFGSGDGAGGEAEQGLGQEFLSDIYIFPRNSISHFALVAIQPCTVKVTDGTGALQQTLDLTSASAKQPIYAQAGSANGNTAISGYSTVGPYTFTGTAPFYIVAQSALDQQETVLLGARQAQLGQFQQEAVARRFRGVQALSDSAIALATTAITAAASNSSARVSAVETLQAEIDSNSAAIVTTNAALATQSSAQVNFTQTLTATVSNEFDPVITWTFNDNSVQSWTATNGTLSPLGSTILFEPTTSNPRIESPNSLNFNGSENRFVRARIKRISGTTWEGNVYWKSIANTGFSGSYRAQITTDPTRIDGETIDDFVVAEWDMFTDSVGSTAINDWKLDSSTNIKQLRFDFDGTATNDFEIDWISVGSKGPGDYRSAVQVEADARVTADGILNAKYTVKIDNNGHISGFGLASDSNSAGDIESRFIVRADSFAVVDPTSPSESGGTTADLTTTNYNDSVPFVIEGGITKVKKVQADSITAQELEVSSTTSGANNSMYFSASSSIRIYDSSGNLRVHIGNLNDTQ